MVVTSLTTPLLSLLDHGFFGENFKALYQISAALSHCLFLSLAVYSQFSWHVIATSIASQMPDGLVYS